MRSVIASRCDVEMLDTRVLALGISTALVMLIAAQAAQAQEYLARETASARKHHAAPEAYDAQANSNHRAPERCGLRQSSDRPRSGSLYLGEILRRIDARPFGRER